jgi:YVTN family beta-propeller protein
MGAPGAPHGLALASDGRTLFVTGRQEVHVLDLEGGKLTTTIPVGLAPHMLHATPDRSRVYTGNMRDGTVSAIDVATRKVIATIPVGRTPEDLAISPDGREMLVGNQDDDSVTVVDLTTHAVVDTVKLPERGAPIRLRYSLDGATVFIASRRDGAGVLRMDRKTRQVTGKIPLDGLCVGMNFTPDGKVLYITDLRAGTIAEVDPVSLKVQRTLATGAGADCIEVVAGAAGSQ